jgi:hypothetical protein
MRKHGDGIHQEFKLIARSEYIYMCVPVEFGTVTKYLLFRQPDHFPHDLTMLSSECCIISDHFKVAHSQEHVLPLHFLTMLNSASVQPSHHFKVAHIQEHVLPLHDLIMLNSAVSSVQHHITLR